jgi:hypothetical protein
MTQATASQGIRPGCPAWCAGHDGSEMDLHRHATRAETFEFGRDRLRLDLPDGDEIQVTVRIAQQDRDHQGGAHPGSDQPLIELRRDGDAPLVLDAARARALGATLTNHAVRLDALRRAELAPVVASLAMKPGRTDVRRRRIDYFQLLDSDRAEVARQLREGAERAADIVTGAVLDDDERSTVVLIAIALKALCGSAEPA